MASIPSRSASLSNLVIFSLSFASTASLSARCDSVSKIPPISATPETLPATTYAPPKNSKRFTSTPARLHLTPAIILIGPSPQTSPALPFRPVRTSTPEPTTKLPAGVADFHPRYEVLARSVRRRSMSLDSATLQYKVCPKTFQPRSRTFPARESVVPPVPQIPSVHATLTPGTYKQLLQERWAVYDRWKVQRDGEETRNVTASLDSRLSFPQTTLVPDEEDELTLNTTVRISKEPHHKRNALKSLFKSAALGPEATLVKNKRLTVSQPRLIPKSQPLSKEQKQGADRAYAAAMTEAADLPPRKLKIIHREEPIHYEKSVALQTQPTKLQRKDKALRRIDGEWSSTIGVYSRMGLKLQAQGF